MLQNTGKSEISRIRALIDLECDCLERIKNGFAVMSSHDIIDRHYGIIGSLGNQLAQLVGEEAAIIEVTERMNTIC